MTSVPIVVKSTTDDYFVLYARHEVDSNTVQYPVKVVLGHEGETTISENVNPLPVERYRLKKFSIANPGDVDGDCIDDITELNDLGPLNPVNHTPRMSLGDGAAALPDLATVNTLAHGDPNGSSRGARMKFIIDDIDSARPRVFFVNNQTFAHHFYFMSTYGIDADALRGFLVYQPELTAPNGGAGMFYIELTNGWRTFSVTERVYTLIAASMPVVDANFALLISGANLVQSQTDLPLYWDSRISLRFDDDFYNDIAFQSLNPGEGYGLLRSLDADERPHSRDVVIYEALPNDLPRVAGVISTVRQTPLSHVNLRAVQDEVPNLLHR